MAGWRKEREGERDVERGRVREKKGAGERERMRENVQDRSMQTGPYILFI